MDPQSKWGLKISINKKEKGTETKKLKSKEKEQRPPLRGNKWDRAISNGSNSHTDTLTHSESNK